MFWEMVTVDARHSILEQGGKARQRGWKARWGASLSGQAGPGGWDGRGSRVRVGRTGRDSRAGADPELAGPGGPGPGPAVYFGQVEAEKCETLRLRIMIILAGAVVSESAKRSPTPSESRLQWISYMVNSGQNVACLQA
jgi:hypothetical protein